MNTLYLVATPIGNLEDITLRALRVLREATLIAAEDTRHTRRLLAHYDIATRCLSYHEHNRLARLDTVLAALATGDVALVSDAGTPALSDPGSELVAACIAAGYPVSPIPGPSSPIAALVASGVSTEQFFFAGFLPRRRSERLTALALLANLPASLICFEAPHRLVDWLTDALDILGDRHIVIARELTKLHEEFLRCTIAEALAHYQEHPPRGEYTLVVAGAAPLAPPQADEATMLHRMQELHAQGHSSSAAARIVAKEARVHKSVVYQLWLDRDSDDSQEMV